MARIEKLDNDTPVPLLDYVAITDPCYVVDDDLWQDFIAIMEPGRHAYIVKISDGSAEAWFIFGNTHIGDGCYDWEAQGNTISINTENSTGDISVDAGLVGIVSFNEDAVRKGIIKKSIDDELTLKKPDRSFLNRASIILLSSYVDGNFEFSFDTIHDINKCWDRDWDEEQYEYDDEDDDEEEEEEFDEDEED